MMPSHFNTLLDMAWKDCMVRIYSILFVVVIFPDFFCRSDYVCVLREVQGALEEGNVSV